jgi:hypothetical protein
MAKLTLNVDAEIARKAKEFAKSQGTSLSKLVSRFLLGLGSSPEDAFFAKLHRELVDEGYSPPSEKNLDKLRQAHMRRKYL